MDSTCLGSARMTSWINNGQFIKINTFQGYLNIPIIEALGFKEKNSF